MIITPKIIRYIISGGSATATNLFLTWSLDQVHLNYLVVVTVAFAISVAVSFTMQKFFTFNDSDTSRTRTQLAFFMCVSLFNLLVNDFIVFVQVEIIHLRMLVLAQAVASILVAFYSFFIYQRLIFKSAVPEEA